MTLKDYKEAQKAVGFTQGNRPKGDFYATPEIAVTSLLSREKFGQTILEPCCGNGAVAKVIEAAGHKVVARDLYDWGYGETGRDFIVDPVEPVDGVITNPPFNLSMEFTKRALECVQEKKGKVAILNRIQWLEGQKRKQMFCSLPLSKVWIFSKRLPRFHRFDFVGKPGTSLLGFAWFVFDWAHLTEPELGWF